MSREPPPQGVESVPSTSRRTILRLVRRLVVAVLGQARLRFCRRQAVAGIRRYWPVHERVVALEPPTLTRLDRPRDLSPEGRQELQQRVDRLLGQLVVAVSRESRLRFRPRQSRLRHRVLIDRFLYRRLVHGWVLASTNRRGATTVTRSARADHSSRLREPFPGGLDIRRVEIPNLRHGERLTHRGHPLLPRRLADQRDGLDLRAVRRGELDVVPQRVHVPAVEVVELNEEVDLA